MVTQIRAAWCNALATTQVPAWNLTLQRCLDDFILSCKASGLSIAFIKSYNDTANDNISYAREKLGITSPQQVIDSDIRRWMLHKQETCKSNGLLSYYKRLHSFFNWLVEEGILERSPTKRVKAPRVPQVLIKPFSQEDIKKLLSFCDENRFVGLRNKTIIILLVETGLRLSELSRLKINDIDFDNGIIHIMGKGARERVVAIQEKTQKLLLRYLLSHTDDYPNLWVTEERRPILKS
jgi:site-specific recombinase XerD